MQHSVVVKELETKLKTALREKTVLEEDLKRANNRASRTQEHFDMVSNNLQETCEEKARLSRKVNRLVRKLKQNANEGKVVDALRVLARTVNEVMS